MSQQSKVVKLAGRLLCGAALGAIAAGGAMAQSISDEIVVSAQRQEQSLQDVPIAVSAFSGGELQNRQIESFQDVQFNIPNFQFSRTQFTNAAIAIRGIGNFTVAASSENAVSVHMNDVFLSAPRIFETEFFDIERIEILRGPQGTLFGRNATGGVINVITAKANPDQVEGYVDAEYGNYDSVKVHGALNLPLGDTLAVRLAGAVIQRDGYTENTWTGQDIDDRNIYALRASVRWHAGDNTTIDFTSSYMREDDSRMRYQKQACSAGPLQPLLGCDPSGPRTFDAVDLRGSIAANASSQFMDAFFTPGFGLYSLATPLTGEPQPTDMRKVAWDTNPQYNAEESIFLVNAKHDFGSWTARLNAGYGNSKVMTSMDFDGGVGPLLTVPAAIQFIPALAAIYGGGQLPVSAFDVGILGPNNGLVGTIGGHVQSRSNRYQAIDMSIGESDYWSVEGIVNTDFDSAFNFMVGASHLRTNGYADYAVASSSLDYFSIVGGTLAALGAAVPDAATTGYSFFVPYFWNDTDDSFLNSTSVFGELYFDISDTLKLTGGIRHNWDTKGLRDRGNLFDSFIALAGGTLPLGYPPFVPLGTPSVRALLDANELVQCQPLGSFCADGGINDFRVVESDFNSTTGRAVLQWTPTDNSQFYASWTRGYKPGGFNPRTGIAGVGLTFDPEIIQAYEVGVKTRVGSLQANLSAFYYDYTGLQISRIVARTSINENVDATIWGLEGEFVWRPTDRFIANMNVSYLNTELGEFWAFNPSDPTAGRADVELIADISNGSNCVITRGAADPAFVGTFTASPFSVCSQLAAAVPGVNSSFGTNYAVLDGIEQNLEGSRLLGSPKFKISGGMQYEIPMGERYSLTPRVDAYYQSEMYTSNFNTVKDRIDGYAYVNAQIRFAPTDGNWHLRAFMQNVTNSDALTGAYAQDQSAGTYQNLFILEPRRWGFGMGMNF